MLHLLCILAICANPTPTAETIISTAESATIDYWEFAPFPKVNYWKIDFDKSDLQAVSVLVGKAKPEDRQMAVFVTSYRGVLRTRNGNYFLEVGEDKRGGKTGDMVLILLRPVKDDTPDYGKQLRFLLEGKEAVQFLDRFYRELAKRAKDRKPFKVTEKMISERSSPNGLYDEDIATMG